MRIVSVARKRDEFCEGGRRPGLQQEGWHGVGVVGGSWVGAGKHALR